MTGHAPTPLIAEYAAGTLPPGMSLLVASHLTYCPGCRAKADRLEALGGALLAEGDEMAPSPRCLEVALARIDRPASPPPVATSGESLPHPLCHRLTQPLCDLRWRPVLPGLASFRLDGFSAEEVGLLRAGPGICLRGKGDPAPEATLVLAGRLRAGNRTYRCGEMKLAAERPEAVGTEPCLCLVVQPRPS